jgi:plasmid stabilization system protein ParE
MPRLIITPRAAVGVRRCHAFLNERSSDTARRANEVIAAQLRLLAINPAIGRPYRYEQAWRELVIRFGDSGYVALYQHIAEQDAVYVIAFRHQREAGY